MSPWKIKSVEHQLGEKLPDFNKWSLDGEMDPMKQKNKSSVGKMEYKC